MSPNMFATTCLEGKMASKDMVDNALEQSGRSLVMSNVLTYGATLHALNQ